MTPGIPDRDPDLDLVIALQRGDDLALDRLMERHQNAIYGFIYRHLLDDADARELTQEVFVHVYFGVAKFRPHAKFATWLYRIALNLCRDHVRSRRARQAAVTDSLSTGRPDGGMRERELVAGGRSPVEAAIIKEKLKALERGLAALPHKLRTVLVMTTLEQRSHQECAELLKTTPKAVEKRLHTARRFLSQWMARAGFIFLLVGWVS